MVSILWSVAVCFVCSLGPLLILYVNFISAKLKMSEILLKFGSFLEKFDYPCINFLDEEQIAELFSHENREVMVLWLIRNLSQEIIIPTDRKAAQILFAEYLYENGFCKSPQKNLFVTGDPSLSIQEEILIFEKIFWYLSIIKEEKDEPIRKTSNYNIDQLIHTDINIFPTPSPDLTEKERHQKIDDYKIKIDELQNEVERFSTMAKDFNHNIETNNLCEELLDVTTFQSKAIKLQEITSTLKQLNNKQMNKELHGFNTVTANSLKSCAAVTMEVVQYLKNLNISFPFYEFDVDTFKENYESMQELEYCSYDIVKGLQSMESTEGI